MKRFWTDYWRDVWTYLTYHPDWTGDFEFWKWFGFLLVWPFNIASFVLGTVASLILIEQLHITALGIRIVTIILSSILSLLLLQGSFSLIDVVVRRFARANPYIETSVAILVLICATLASGFVIYFYLQTHPFNTGVIDASAILATLIKLAPLLIALFNFITAVIKLISRIIKRSSRPYNQRM